MNPSQKIQRIQHFFRKIGILPIIEKLRYLLSVFNCYFRNKSFIFENPNFILPPKALAYDAYSAPDWPFYKKSGEDTASFLSKIAKKYLTEAQSLYVLEWGCGPGRVIRHIPSIFSVNDKIYGADYNQETIAWCKKSILKVNFALNGLRPPVEFQDEMFDFIYSISVFTHLSEEVSQKWIAELYRVAQPGAILVITTNGDSRQAYMLPEELDTYLEKGIVIRNKVEEGKKMFFACHSPNFLREKLFNNFEILEQVSASFPYTGQDYWVLRKQTKQ